MALTLLSALRFYGWDYRMTDKNKQIRQPFAPVLILMPDNCIE